MVVKMSAKFDLTNLFSQQIREAETFYAASQSEPLKLIAQNCLHAFQQVLLDLQAGKVADTTFTNSHSNTKNRTDLTRAIADAYGFTILGEASPHRAYNPASFKIFEELKVAASALYASNQYKAPITKTHPSRQPERV